MNEQELAVAFGLKVREKRKRTGITQKDLAETIGVTRVYIGFIERGDTSITLAKVYRLATALNCNVADLLPLDAIRST
jgi:transcriptional regulator with XRE-family HTH domain